MALWYQPPPPFIGGFQPYDGRKFIPPNPIGTPYDLGHNQSAGAASLAISTINAVATGDLIVLVHYCNNSTGTISSVTDTAGNTYQVAASQTTAPMAQYWYAFNCTAMASSSTITANFNGGGSLRHGISAFGCSGIATTAPLDTTTNTVTGTGTGPDTLTWPTPVQADELEVVGLFTAAAPGAITWSQNLVAVGGNTATAFALPAWQIVRNATPPASTPSWVNSILRRTLGVSFKGIGAPPPIPPDKPPLRQFVAMLTLTVGSWPADSWPAQRGAMIYSLVPPDVPNVTRDRQNFGAVLSWAREDWTAQRSGIIAPILPIRVDRPPTQRFIPNLISILAWPREDWRPQRSGITIQSGGASPVTLPLAGFENLRPFSSIKDALTVQYLSRIRNVVNNIMRGKINATLNLSLVPLTTTTTINDPRIGGSTYIALEPLTTNAAAELATGNLFVSSQGAQFVTFTHNNSFTTDRSFIAILIG